MKLSYDVLKFASSMALILSLVAPSTRRKQPKIGKQGQQPTSRLPFLPFPIVRKQNVLSPSRNPRALGSIGPARTVP
jgi:hypothetical protein